jgi:hypothetical protein
MRGKPTAHGFGSGSDMGFAAVDTFDSLGSAKDFLLTVVAAISDRTFGATRFWPLAQFLTVLPEQLVCPDQRIVVSGELRMYRIQNQTVCRWVTLLLLGEAHSTQHSQAIRVERHYWMW